MVPRWFIWFWVIVCSIIGAYIPMIWGAGVFSFSSVILSGIGGIAGVFLAVKLGNSM